MSLMTNEELNRLAADLPFIKSWVKAVEDEVKLALEQGAEFSNAKLEPTRPTRKWVDGLDILKLLRKFSKLDVVAPRVPLSPAQAEKTLGKKLFKDKLAESVVSQSSGLKLTFSTKELEN